MKIRVKVKEYAPQLYALFQDLFGHSWTGQGYGASILGRQEGPIEEIALEIRTRVGRVVGFGSPGIELP